MKLSDCLKAVYQMACAPSHDGKYTAFEKDALKEYAELYNTVVELELEEQDAACPEAIETTMAPISAEAAAVLTRIMNEILTKKFKTDALWTTTYTDEDNDE